MNGLWNPTKEREEEWLPSVALGRNQEVSGLAWHRHSKADVMLNNELPRA